MDKAPFRIFATLILLSASFGASALEVCDLPPRYGVSPVAAAIVRVACDEHRLWYRPFMDSNGRLASVRVTEAERAELADGGIEAWQRVVIYWRDSGTLASMAESGIKGAQNCQYPDGSSTNQNECRAYLIDNPWSAAFVSYVMTRAQVPGFHSSPRHMDYIRAAYHNTNGTGAYRLSDPATGKPAPGDLLCFLRSTDTELGPAGLRDALAGNRPLPAQSHCDIVIAANPGGDRTLYLIGGNVFDTVTMRKLPLDRLGLVQFPTAPPPDAATGLDNPVCSPANEPACNFSRQDWVALLKLTPPGTTSVVPEAP